MPNFGKMPKKTKKQPVLQQQLLVVVVVVAVVQLRWASGVSTHQFGVQAHNVHVLFVSDLDVTLLGWI